MQVFHHPPGPFFNEHCIAPPLVSKVEALYFLTPPKIKMDEESGEKE